MSLNRIRQKIWFCKRTEKLVNGIHIPVYGKPVLKHYTVSSTSGSPDDVAAGIIPDYDRYITRDKMKDRYNTFEFAEDDVLWVDREPQLDDDGNVSLTENGEAIVPPDYVLKKILDSQKSLIERFGISKITGQ